jgi:hypothetical protein
MLLFAWTCQLMLLGRTAIIRPSVRQTRGRVRMDTLRVRLIFIAAQPSLIRMRSRTNMVGRVGCRAIQVLCGAIQTEGVSAAQSLQKTRSGLLVRSLARTRARLVTTAEATRASASTAVPIVTSSVRVLRPTPIGQKTVLFVLTKSSSARQAIPKTWKRILQGAVQMSYRKGAPGVVRRLNALSNVQRGGRGARRQRRAWVAQSAHTWKLPGRVNLNGIRKARVSTCA